MIYDFNANNVNDMTYEVMQRFKELEVPIEGSRNGPVIRFPRPCSLTYTKPWERVSFSPNRDANPFFHLMESMWMLAGRNDVVFLNLYNKGMKQFSDDGIHFNAAYGQRARYGFGFDQLVAAANHLQEWPNSRQAVVLLWDAKDLVNNTKDKACNLEMLFFIQDGSLCMTVFNRSNDAILGALGANVVHMSFFQQYIADSLGLPMGNYYQISNNMHIYVDGPKTAAVLKDGPHYNLYRMNEDMAKDALNRRLFKYPETNHSFDKDCDDFCEYVVEGKIIGENIRFSNEFIQTVCVPMHNLFISRDDQWAQRIAALDWRCAAASWVERRKGQATK